MKRYLKVLLYFGAAIYPLFVFLGLVVLKLPVRIFSLCIVSIAAVYFLYATGLRGSEKKRSILDYRPVAASFLLISAGLVCFFTQQTVFLKLYSVIINGMLLLFFGSTLFF
ncbi:MAG: hypothetical protein J5631_07070 [Spirochaetaceae bacterium]|nr:hypothetical protein [Spirochaetaceae bacterium]